MKIPRYALPHKVTVYKFKGSGAYGPQWDEVNPRRNVPCRIVPLVRNIKSQDGSDVVQQAQGIFHPDYPVKVGDKVKWDMMGAEYVIESVAAIDAMGLHHFEVVLV